MALFARSRTSPLVVTWRTYEPSDFDDYVAYLGEANRDTPDFAPIEGPAAMERVLLQAPSYRRNGHFLALDGGRIVADAVAMDRPRRGGRLGFVQWNALAGQGDEATFDGLLGRCLAYLSGKVTEVRLLLRPEHAAARGVLTARGLAPTGSLSRFAGSATRTRSGRAVRAMRLEDVETVAAILTRAYEDDPLFSLVAIEGPFGMAILRDAASGACFVAERDDRPVGVVGIGARGDVGFVDFLAVDPDYRRTGIGSSLLSTALFWMSQRGCARGLAVADPANEAAAEFYRRFGFAATEPEHRVVYGTPPREGAPADSTEAGLGRV